jgi:hypothetical protein
LSCVCRLLAQTEAPAPVGRPKTLSDAQVDALTSPVLSGAAGVLVK